LITDSESASITRTFAIGDLHGEITSLRQLLARMQPTLDDTLIFLGDYVDRGEDSVAICEELLRLQEQETAGTGPRIIALRGNHDDAWLEVWTGHGYSKAPVIPSGCAVWEEYRDLPPASIERFLVTTSLTYDDECGFYYHAGIAPRLPPQEAGAEVWKWGTGGFHTSSPCYSKPIVFEHYEVVKSLVTPQRICMYTAGYRTGVLTAIYMESREMIQVKRAQKYSRMGSE
jgi:serine/threonine protein phosphatase 1